jgi:hypothetical protein
MTIEEGKDFKKIDNYYHNISFETNDLSIYS